MTSLNTLLAVSIAAIVIASITAVFVVSSQTEQQNPQTQEIVLFSDVDEDIDEDKFGVPPDLFSHEQIVLNQGDTLKVQFLNLEPVESQEHHSFTIENGPYAMDVDINAGEQADFEIIADTPGIYEYVCTYHEPTMRGQLVVLG